MAKPYSEDLRTRVIGAVEDGATIPETADQCGVSVSRGKLGAGGVAQRRSHGGRELPPA